MLSDFTIEVWDMFLFLHGSRVTSENGPGLIPLGEYLSFFSLYGIGDDTIFYTRLLRATDRAWLTRFYENRNA